MNDYTGYAEKPFLYWANCPLCEYSRQFNTKCSHCLLVVQLGVGCLERGTDYEDNPVVFAKPVMRLS